MTDHMSNREDVISFLRHELVGPSGNTGSEPAVGLAASEVDLTGEVSFPTRDAAYGPFVQAGTREEVLLRDRPCKRYGVAVLYPLRIPLEDEQGVGEDTLPDIESSDPEAEVAPLTAGGQESLRPILEARTSGAAEDDDFELTGANEYRPSTMAISFLAELPTNATLVVTLNGGRYRQKRVLVEGRERTWWLRSPVEVTARFAAAELVGSHNRLATPNTVEATGVDGLDLQVSVFARKPKDRRRRPLLTVSVSNRTPPPGRGGPDAVCLFQTRFRVHVEVDGVADPAILPYPGRPQHGDTSLDEEQQSFDLLYRKMKTFGVGHGCAADWDGPEEKRVAELRAEPLPVVETPSITPQVFEEEDDVRTEVTVPMGPLAGLDPDNDGFQAMTRVVDLYETWLRDDQHPQVKDLDEQYRSAAGRHLESCERALRRMRRGLVFLDDPTARRAFQLANEAVLLQQLRTRRTARPTVLDGARIRITEPLTVPNWRDASGRGSWRPFQIAFILSALESVADPDHEERDTVELIWFPTGGGKTEAYLGLAAFALFYRRLADPKDHGVEVLMRYTLRLLTQQQFQRAASLICAMESIRRRSDDLGDAPFSIGMWLGGDTTPNRREDARQSLRQLNQGDSWAENKFVILRCPWCAAAMGPLPTTGAGRRSRNIPRVAGYIEDGGTVIFRCPDPSCEFAPGLPLYVIDEDIYEQRPSVVIATVDKFAQLAWDPRCRSLFGIGPDGTRITSPPQTIIQDELHLIAGPLGSVVGLYESVIEQLCTDERKDQSRRPKIISSTATIRRYEDQVAALYARKNVELFPPRALDASDSFFASFARNADGTLSPGRKYLGVHAPGLGSIQTAQVRTFAALLQAPHAFDTEAQDPWWTLMVFFNSLRELGTSLSLLQSDIPDYLKVIRNRFNLRPSQLRRIRSVLELTGRLNNDDVPKSIEQLSQPAGADAVDVCLASNVIEVGIDIDRLSLMTVVGQPKSTSTYIQVTGRVGRQWATRPGLVVTILSPTKPRDRSHFEKFRSYHERLYAQVEPTSVTPFSPPCARPGPPRRPCRLRQTERRRNPSPLALPRNNGQPRI